MLSSSVETGSSKTFSNWVETKTNDASPEPSFELAAQPAAPAPR